VCSVVTVPFELDVFVIRRKFEQRANIKFMCKLGISASETLSALQQAYSDTALKKSAVYNWFSQLKYGQETLEDDQRSGRPSTSRTEEMIGKVQLIRYDQRMTTVAFEQEVGIIVHATSINFV
jgi:transposase